MSQYSTTKSHNLSNSGAVRWWYRSGDSRKATNNAARCSGVTGMGPAGPAEEVCPPSVELDLMINNKNYCTDTTRSITGTVHRLVVSGTTAQESTIRSYVTAIRCDGYQ